MVLQSLSQHHYDVVNTNPMETSSIPFPSHIVNFINDVKDVKDAMNINLPHIHFLFQSRTSTMSMTRRRRASSQAIEDPADMMTREREDDDGSKKDEAKSVCRNRTNMTIFHFFMTAPKWSLSLFLFLASCQIPMRSPGEAIGVPRRNLNIALSAEAHAYQNCVVDVRANLEQELQLRFLNEIHRVETAYRSNEVSLKKFGIDRKQCEEKSNIAREHLVLQQNSTLANFTIKEESNCKKEDQELIQSILNGEVELITDNVLSDLDSYMEQSTKSMEYIRSYAIERFGYVHTYFVVERIQPVLEALAVNTTCLLYTSPSPRD